MLGNTQTIKVIKDAAREALSAQFAELKPLLKRHDILEAALVLGLNDQTIDGMFRANVGDVFTALIVRDYFRAKKGVENKPLSLPKAVISVANSNLPKVRRAAA